MEQKFIQIDGHNYQRMEGTPTDGQRLDMALDGLEITHDHEGVTIRIQHSAFCRFWGLVYSLMSAMENHRNPGAR